MAGWVSDIFTENTTSAGGGTPWALSNVEYACQQGVVNYAKGTPLFSYDSSPVANTVPKFYMAEISFINNLTTLGSSKQPNTLLDHATTGSDFSDYIDFGGETDLWGISGPSPTLLTTGTFGISFIFRMIRVNTAYDQYSHRIYLYNPLHTSFTLGENEHISGLRIRIKTSIYKGVGAVTFKFNSIEFGAYVAEMDTGAGFWLSYIF